MTIFINDSHAGSAVRGPQQVRVPGAAVWEPSGFKEGTAAERGVRTLQPADRTQRRVIDPVLPRPNATWEDRARRRRDVWTTYLVGALFGSALIGAAILGDSGESVYPAHAPAPVPAVEVR